MDFAIALLFLQKQLHIIFRQACFTILSNLTLNSLQNFGMTVLLSDSKFQRAILG
jgi:hypothetical protein